MKTHHCKRCRAEYLVGPSMPAPKKCSSCGASLFAPPMQSAQTPRDAKAVPVWARSPTAATPATVGETDGTSGGGGNGRSERTGQPSWVLPLIGSAGVLALGAGVVWWMLSARHASIDGAMAPGEVAGSSSESTPPEGLGADAEALGDTSAPKSPSSSEAGQVTTGQPTPSQATAEATSGGTAGTASQRWRLLERGGLAAEVHAASILGAAKFDRQLVESLPVDGAVEQLSEIIQNLPARYRQSYAADLARRVSRLSAERPLFEVVLRVPEVLSASDSVSVFLKVDPRHRSLFAAGVGDECLVSAASEIPLEVGTFQPGVMRTVEEADARFVLIPLSIPWDVEGLRSLTTTATIPFTLSIRFQDGSKRDLTHEVQIHPPTDFEFGYPCDLVLASAVDERHPWVGQIISAINHDPVVVRAGQVLSGAGADSEVDVLGSTYLVWRYLTQQQVRYSNLVASTVQSQRVRPLHESIGGGDANCLDGSVMVASLLAAQGVDVALVLVPGHAFVAVECDGGDFGIETTALGLIERQDPDTPVNGLFDRVFRERGAPWSAFANDPSLNSFELAIARGTECLLRAESECQQLSRALDEARSRLPESPTDAQAQAFLKQSAEVGQSFRYVNIQLARRLGIEPVGAPKGIGTAPR